MASTTRSSTSATTKAPQSGAKKATASNKEPIKKVKGAKVKKSTPVKKKQQKTKATTKVPVSQPEPPSATTQEEEVMDVDSEEEFVPSSKKKKESKPRKKGKFVLIRGEMRWQRAKQDVDTITVSHVEDEERVAAAQLKARSKKATKAAAVSKGKEKKNVAKATGPNEPCHFLQLPLELRDIIYSQILPDQLRVQYKKLMPSWHQETITLPNIMFLNKQVFEECQALVLRNAVYIIDFLHEPIHVLVAQYKNALRGLRSNKAMAESIDCLNDITKFKKVVLRLSLPWNSRRRQQVWESAMIIFEFLDKNGPLNMTISFDLYGVFQDCGTTGAYYGGIRAHAENIVKEVRICLERSPRCMLEGLTSRAPNRKWPQRTVTMIKDLYKRTNQTMLKSGESLLVGDDWW